MTTKATIPLPTTLTQATLAERAQSAACYLREVHAELLIADGLTLPSHTLQNTAESSYARMMTAYYLDTAPKAGYDAALIDYADALPRDVEYMKMADMTYWLIYPFRRNKPESQSDLPTPHLRGRVTIPRRQQKAALRLVEPFTTFPTYSDETMWTANSILWLDFVEQHVIADILQKMLDIVDTIGRWLIMPRMYFVRPFIKKHLMATAHDATTRMIIPYAPGRPPAWQQSVYTQAFLDLFTEREPELVELFYAALIATHKER